jgi:hypothetical protein
MKGEEDEPDFSKQKPLIHHTIAAYRLSVLLLSVVPHDEDASDPDRYGKEYVVHGIRRSLT